MRFAGVKIVGGGDKGINGWLEKPYFYVWLYKRSHYIMLFQMRDLVTHRLFRLRKYVDNALYRLLPGTWMPLYNSVMFSHIPYSRCVRNKLRHDKVRLSWFLPSYFLLIILSSCNKLVCQFRFHTAPSHSGPFYTYRRIWFTFHYFILSVFSVSSLPSAPSSLSLFLLFLDSDSLLYFQISPNYLISNTIRPFAACYSRDGPHFSCLLNGRPQDA